MDSNSVIERLKKYCSANPDIVNSGYIKGIDSSNSTIVIEKDGTTRNITIDELESNSWLNNTATVEEPVEVMEEPEEVLVNEPIETIETMDDPKPVVQESNTASPIESPSVLDNLDVTPSASISTLKNMQDAITSKDEASINKALETFAMDEKTGTININKAIKIITDNSTNNVVEAVRNNAELSTDLSNYDITGKPLTSFAQSQTPINVDKLIEDSFKNILVYVEAAKLKNIIYNDSQILAAKNKYATGVHDKLNVQGLSKKEETDTTTDEGTSTESTVSDIKPDTDIKKAGFADVLILTIIVLVYAAIIVNLVSKLK